MSMQYQTYSHQRNWGARVTEFEYRGYPMVTMENRFLRVVIAAGKGTDIIEFLYKPLDVDFLWRSFTGLRSNYNFIPTVANPSGSFVDFYAGGWQEMFPNAGGPCTYKGAALGVHGEVCLLPWTYQLEKNDPQNIAVTFRVRSVRTPFCLEKTLSMNDREATLTIDEVVRNEGDEALDFMWGHHPALGWPFLDASCRLFLPRCRVRTPAEYTAPSSRLEKGQDTEWSLVRGRSGEMIDLSRGVPPEARSHDMAYIYDLDAGWYAAVNGSTGTGFGMHWEKDVFPFLWFWQLYRGGTGYPWYGTAYTAALEPVSSYPPTLTEAIKAGTHKTLPTGGELRTRLVAVAFADRQEVREIDPLGRVY